MLLSHVGHQDTFNHSICWLNVFNQWIYYRERINIGQVLQAKRRCKFTVGIIVAETARCVSDIRSNSLHYTSFPHFLQACFYNSQICAKLGIFFRSCIDAVINSFCVFFQLIVILSLLLQYTITTQYFFFSPTSDRCSSLFSNHNGSSDMHTHYSTALRCYSAETMGI